MNCSNLGALSESDRTTDLEGRGEGEEIPGRKIYIYPVEDEAWSGNQRQPKTITGH